MPDPRAWDHQDLPHDGEDWEDGEDWDDAERWDDAEVELFAGDHDDEDDEDGFGNEWSDDDRPRRRLTRRGFIGMAGVGAGAAALAGAGSPVAAAIRRRRGEDGDGGRGGGRDGGRGGNGGGGGRGGDGGGATRLGRMFPDLPPFAEPSDELIAALVELGAPGGIMDANDPLEVGPARLISDPSLSPNNPDNPNQPAGYTYLGQFITHDITLDTGSVLGRPTPLGRSTNLRTPSLDLDSVYGGGPAESPGLYTTDPIRFIVESGGLFEDLPRDGDGSAILPDARNDENVIIGGLHAAMLLFHNAVAERVEASGLTGLEAFEETRRLVRWHYQWIVLHEYLAVSLDQQVLADVVTNGRRFFDPGRQVRMPVEFQTAAFRFGHAIIRPSYRVNLAGDGGGPFTAMIFDINQLGGADPDNLLGGHRAPRRFVGWQSFFDFGDGQAIGNKRINTRVSSPMFNLPPVTLDDPRGGGPLRTSIATRDLLRDVTWELPSGQAVAQAMGMAPLAPGDLADLAPLGADLDVSTPLWVYTLREADVVNQGLRLGPMASRLVAEVLHGLLAADETSFLAAEPGWRPTLPSQAGDGEFHMIDLLALAGVDPASRGQ